MNITLEQYLAKLNPALNKTHTEITTNVCNIKDNCLVKTCDWLSSMLPKDRSLVIILPSTDEQQIIEVLVFNEVTREYIGEIKFSITHVKFEHDSFDLTLHYGKIFSPRTMAKIVKHKLYTPINR